MLNIETHDHALRDLGALAQEVIASLPHRSKAQAVLLDRLRGYAARLSNERFQLAVLGQFKRGKSTLLNALIGQPLLATGVLPLTAIPTFLQGGSSFCVTLIHSSGEVEQHAASTVPDLAQLIAEATTEEYNPENRRHLARVEVALPSCRWLGAVTLIDTPGIGSTHSHNTAAAHDVLPECDAALFVLSVDPPITETELNYFALASQTASRIIVVLNKVDLVDEADRERALSFIRSVLAKQGLAQADSRIFPISARAAFDARLAGDDRALIRSGLPALEQYVEETLVKDKRDVLENSIAAKMSAVVDRLHDETELSLRALTIPLVALDEKIAIFDRACAEFEQERERLDDLLSGEWRRTLAKLETLCNEADSRVRAELSERLAASLGPISVSESVKDHVIVKKIMEELFDKEFRAIVETIEAAISSSVDNHQQRYLALIYRVRVTAASLMDTSVSETAIDEPFQRKRDPYWVSEARIESLGSVTLEGLARLLPKRTRQQRQRRQLLANANAAVFRNIASLHWATRQNIDDTFRRLLHETADSVATNIGATRDLLLGARKQRREQTERLHATIRQTGSALKTLAVSRDLLGRKRTSPA